MREFLAADGTALAFVVTGGPGIGKTTLWEAGRNLAAERGFEVLAARPSEAEGALSFVALADLLDVVDPKVFTRLPPPQAAALAVALLRTDPLDNPPAPRAIAAGLLGVLRALASRRPLLLAIDDAHWLDEASLQSLSFAARRLGSAPVSFLLARRDSEASALERAFHPARLVELKLGPLSYGAVRSVLSRRIAVPLPRRALRRVFETSGGNPFFALELGRVLVERGLPDAGDELPVPEPIKEIVEARVARFPPRLRKVLLAVALSPGLRRAELESLVGDAVVDEAVDAGALVIGGERVRAGHPLLATAARARTRARERREVHLELAAVVEDEEFRARHLALGTDRPDAALATRIAAASARAAARGAVADSVDLAGHALRLTPPEVVERSDRVLALAERLLVTGEHERASVLLASEFDSLPKGPARARAHLLLSRSDFLLMHVDESGAHIQAALVESVADPALHAIAAAAWSGYLMAGRVERIEEAERCAREALPAARRAGPAAERQVLYALAFARKLRGIPIDDLCERFAAVSPDAFHLQQGVERFAAERLGTRGHVREARAAFRKLLALADERGEAFSSMWLLFQLCELELRAGEWKAASELLDECDESPDRLLMDTRAYDRCRALLAVGRGRWREAEQLASRTIDADEAQGFRWNLLEALRARGLAALLAHDPERAVESLLEVWRYTERQGVDEPAEFPVAPDLVEALLEVGRRDDAAAVINRLRRLAEAQEHPWGLATVKRCEGLLETSAAGDDRALASLEEAAAAYSELGLRFDEARTLLAGGRAARRLKKWRVARELLERSSAAFEAMGSDGWSAEARSELARVGARRPEATGVLTTAEQQVAGLAADGYSNKEIAGALSITVATVETHLKHVYAKLGVRSRTQLSGRLRSMRTPVAG